MTYDSSPEQIIIKNSPQAAKFLKNTEVLRKRIITIDSSSESSVDIKNSPEISRINQNNGLTKLGQKTLPDDLNSATDSEPRKNIKRKFVKQRQVHYRRRKDFLQSDSERSEDSEDSDMTDLIDDKPVKSELPLDLAKNHFLEQDRNHENFLLKRFVFHI